MVDTTTGKYVNVRDEERSETEKKKTRAKRNKAEELAFEKEHSR